MKENTQYQTNLFRFAAVLNTTIGLIIIFAHQWLFTLLAFELTAIPAFNAITQVAGVAIVTFGIGYYLVSQSIKENKGIIILGIISKFAVFVIFTLAYLNHPSMLPFFIAGIGELGFILLFFNELNKLKSH